MSEEELNSINDILEGYENTGDITQTENVTTDVITTEADDDEITSAHIKILQKNQVPMKY